MSALSSLCSCLLHATVQGRPPSSGASSEVCCHQRSTRCLWCAASAEQWPREKHTGLRSQWNGFPQGEKIIHSLNNGSEITCGSKLLRFHRGRSSKPIFVQIAKQVVSLNPLELRLPSRAWKVKLVGEGADDAGGVFDDTITEMCQVGRSSVQQGQQIMEQVMLCNILSVLLMYFIIYNIHSYYQELQSGVVDLLIHTPNGFADVGSNTDRCSFYGHLIIKQYPCNITTYFHKMTFTFNTGSAALKVPTESSGILRGSHDPVSLPGHPHGRGYPHQETSGSASGSLGLETALLNSTGRRWHRGCWSAHLPNTPRDPSPRKQRNHRG